MFELECKFEKWIWIYSYCYFTSGFTSFCSRQNFQEAGEKISAKTYFSIKKPGVFLAANRRKKLRLHERSPFYKAIT